jgi:hypothetical protein
MDAAHDASERPRSSSGSSSSSSSPSRAAIVLGNDAVVAARPAQPAQLTHACRAAGFDVVVPPSWGDELVAGEFIERLSGCGDRTAIGCACPKVRALLARQQNSDTALRVDITAPPVAVARYLRLVYGNATMITYVGECPSADDPSINARFSPLGFFASLHRQGISLTEQPNAVTDSEQARWQRYRSIPGGFPALRWLARAPVDRVMREADAQIGRTGAWPTTKRSNVLVDLADAVGCVCGGGRATIEQTEPVRAMSPVIVAPPDLDLRVASSLAPPRVVAESERATDASTVSPVVADRPTRALPITAATTGATPPTRSLTRPRHTVGANAAAPEPGRQTARLATLPLIVLALAAALGAAAYSFTAPARIQGAPAAGESTPPPHVTSVGGLDTVRRPTSTVVDSGVGARPTAADSGATASGTIPAGTAAKTDSTRVRRRRAPRKFEVVPGWMPQSAEPWTPADSARPARDSVRRKPTPD